VERHTDNVQNLSGDAVSAVTITVRRVSDNALASLFSDNGVTPKSNPFTNDADGELFFYALNNDYNVELTGAVTETRFGVTLFDQNDTLLRRNILEISASGAITQGDVALVDVTAGAIAIELPLDPGATVQFSDIVIQHLAGDITSNPITIERNGELIGGVAADVVMDVTDQRAVLVWGGSTLGWAIDLSKGSGASVSAFNDLSDVILTAPANFNSLRFDGSDWVNSAMLQITGSGATMGGITLGITGMSVRGRFDNAGESGGSTQTTLAFGDDNLSVGFGEIEWRTTGGGIDGDSMYFRNRRHAGHIEFEGEDSGGVLVPATDFDPDVPLYTIRVDTVVEGDLQIDNELNHDGLAIGYFGTAPATITAAYTQTFATATRTHANPTAAALTDSTGGAANQTVVAITAVGGSGATTTQEGEINDNFADVTDEINKLILDLANVKELVNSVIDDRQTYGDFQ
jgi:hypothetical protein